MGQYTFRKVKDRVMAIGHLRGCTMTGDAIKHAIQHFEVLGRPGVERILLLLTDGQSNDEVDNPSKQARENGILKMLFNYILIVLKLSWIEASYCMDYYT